MPKITKQLPEAGQEIKGRSAFNPSTADAQAVLESDRETHLRELDELRAQLKDKLEPQIEQADPTVSEQDKNLVLVRQLEAHVAEINQALEAAQKGTYGICEHCGQPIGPERLRILPETRLCVRCKGQIEKTMHHHKRRL